MWRFVVLFLFLLLSLFFLELFAPIQQGLIIPFTEGLAHLSAWIVMLFDPHVASEGIILRNTENGFAVRIQAGCNGVEASIVLIAAVLSFPASLYYKVWGVIIGFLAIQGVNLLRIISLFYLGQWNETLFNWAHLYLWQILIMLDALIVFLLWLKYLPKTKKNA
jgi:exosortase H (IPTLxxWG-CTERM-specific)